MQDRDIVAVED